MWSWAQRYAKDAAALADHYAELLEDDDGYVAALNATWEFAHCPRNAAAGCGEKLGTAIAHRIAKLWRNRWEAPGDASAAPRGNQTSRCAGGPDRRGVRRGYSEGGRGGSAPPRGAT